MNGMDLGIARTVGTLTYTTSDIAAPPGSMFMVTNQSGALDHCRSISIPHSLLPRIRKERSGPPRYIMQVKLRGSVPLSLARGHASPFWEPAQRRVQQRGKSAQFPAGLSYDHSCFGIVSQS